MIKLILFTSSHCPGCVPMKKKINDIVLEMPKSIAVDFVNIDDNDENLHLAQSLFIQSTPTLLIKVGDKIQDMIIGNVPVETIIKSIGSM